MQLVLPFDNFSIKNMSFYRLFQYFKKYRTTIRYDEALASHIVIDKRRHIIFAGTKEECVTFCAKSNDKR